MNVSQPVASYIGSVNFGVISSKEIHQMSAKRIQNPETFDTLLHPTPGGLYDLALGAWSDYTCTTCELKMFACPGHPGHIDLPVPIYHCSWMDQLMKLLQGQCPYCFRFRLPATMKNGFICKLQLLQYGLVADAQHIDRLEVRERERDDSSGGDQDADEANEELIKKQNRFVRRSITKAGLSRDPSGMVKSKTETVVQARRLVLTDVISALGKPTKCGFCGERPFKWRKDKFNKIFRDTANSRKKDQPRKQHENPLMLEIEAAKTTSQAKKPDEPIDEAIELELDDQPSPEVEAGLIMDGAADMAPAEKEAAPAVQGRKNEFVNAAEVRAYIRHLFNKEQNFLNLIYSADHIGSAKRGISPDMFFIDTLLVPPNRYRPDAKTGDGQITEAQQNTLYKNILKSCIALHQIQMELSGQAEPMNRRRDFGDLQNLWVALQDHVNALFDSERNTAPRRGKQEAEEGIKQKLEKKEGLFRMNMMGKRVNFAARSVISPDPNIETNEIGVPPVFAKKLTYPEPVTNHNFDDLKEAVMNGQERWPGAAAIENENGQVISLLRKSAEERQALANQLLAPSSTSVTGSRNKKVHRHLRNGDIVIMNRQPTLHKPSMMCHRARVLPGEKTIRMHYANCNTYNADFDGDEMNMHFPQSLIARAEAYEIADTDHQYLVATSGKPLRGLIQDHLSMGVWLTNRDTFFNRGDYHQLLYSSLRPEDGHTATERILTVPPAIVKPQALWTGKQVVTTVLKNVKPADYQGLTMMGKEGKTAIGWSDKSEEKFLLLQDGEFLTGILDKGHLGPTDGGFIHSIYEAYGHKTAGRLLSVLGRLLTKFLHMRAWSCGVADIVLTPEGNQVRKEQLREVDDIGIKVATKYVSLEGVSSSDDAELQARLNDVLRDTEKHAGLDGVYATQNADLTSKMIKAIMPQYLWRPFPWNQMQTMTSSGAKGSAVNANLISCNLGQQVLEGRRVPVMVSGKTLPSFKPFETDVRAGGFIANRFLTGVQPQEYYFHAMAGREGLIDTAVKTARSGYLQRCIIKGMEGLKVEYDSSVRDTDGSVIQFLYGEDGLDVTKMKHLTDFKFLAENLTAMAANLNLQQGYSRLFNETALLWNKKALKKIRKGDSASMDPATAHFNPGAHWGSTSEAFAQALKDYIDNNPDNLIKDKKKAATSEGVSKKIFETLVQMKYLKSVVDPGEAVGIVAGQSVGEPSTQMTLNTFHLAGHAAKNVTLGIPRLREIVMTASRRIMTPTMTLRLASGIDEETAKQFAKGITRLSFAETVESVQVREMVTKGQHYQQARIYRVKLNLYPQEELQREYAITTRDVQTCVEHSFLAKLTASIKKDLKAKWKADAKNPNSSLPEVGKSSGIADEMKGLAAGPEVDAEMPEKAADEGGEEDTDDEAQPDDDATQAKMKKGQVDNYDDEDEDMEPEEDDAGSDDGAAAPKAPEEPEDEGYVGSPKPHAADKVAVSEPTDYEQAVMARHNDLSGFKFDSAASTVELTIEYDVNVAKVLVLNHVESACRAALVQFIEGVGACTLSSEKVKVEGGKKAIDVPVVITQGCNLLAMRDYQDYIDPHRMETNDIGATLEYYGVEAARNTIIREMSAVFEGHSIQVDNRHLNLIGDMMTRHGGFAPFNRYGMKSSTSPFMKMSFETTVGFLKDAVLAAERDELLNPSARIVTGKTSGVGTGAFDVLLPINQGTPGVKVEDEVLPDAEEEESEL